MPTPPTDAPSGADLLTRWCADQAAPLEDVVAALAADDPTVDTFLAGPARDLSFARKLLGEHVFELGLVLDESPPLPSARWLALAQLDPAVFAWNLEADSVLPLSNEAASRELSALLLSALADRESRSVLLGWLGHPSFLGDEHAIDRIEDSLAEAGAALTWEDRVQTVRTLARRGGRWEAARALERLLRRASPDGAESKEIQRVARSIADATLLSVLGRHAPWSNTPEWLGELAAEIPTTELIEAFAHPDGEVRARRLAESPSPAHRAAWSTLARRNEPEARDTVGRLILRTALFLGDETLAAGLTATLVTAQGEAAVRPLVAGFLAGLHRRAPGAAIERFLRSHPRRALVVAMELLPDWVHTFDEDAMARLVFRLLPRLTPEQRQALADEARLQDGARGRILLDELDALG